MSVKNLFEDMADRFNPEAWGDKDAVLQFNITGDGGGTYVADIQGGKVSVSEGPADNATMTVTCSAEDFRAIADGDLNGVSAFMAGKLKIDGDMSLAMKLQTLLS